MEAIYTVRHACISDTTELLVLMRELARFEGYIEQFCVTENDLLERGLCEGSSQQFIAFVAEAGNGEMLGYALVYMVPFTFDLQPNLILKELYVRETRRGIGIGHALMAAVLASAKELGCARLKWDVLQNNMSAQAFYRSIGGLPDSDWESWIRVLA